MATASWLVDEVGANVGDEPLHAGVVEESLPIRSELWIGQIDVEHSSGLGQQGDKSR